MKLLRRLVFPEKRATLKKNYSVIYLFEYVNSRFDIDFLESSTELLRAMAHPIRLAIIDLLKEGTKLSVTEIHESLDIEQAVASHHLRILKDKNVLNSRRKGKNTFYSLRHLGFSDIVKSLETLIV